MIAKELIEARWKILVGSLVTLLAAVFVVFSYEWIRVLVASPSLAVLPANTRQQLAASLGDFDTYAWSQWYAKNAPLILGAVAAFLGGGLIAGEVGKGTIFFLLGKPVSRTRVLLTKFGVAAGILLAVDLLGSLGLGIAAALQGHPQPLGGTVLSLLLLWLGTLSVLSAALLFSVLFDDQLRPVGLALLAGVVLGLPGIVGQLLPGWGVWSLPAYWASLPAYLGTAFPAQEFAICLVAALLPLALALPLFRGRMY